jgi:hypothetical protein
LTGFAGSWLACGGLDATIWPLTFTDTKEKIMQQYLVILGFCVVIMTAIAVYFPTIYIRKTNKLMALLEKIEANTRK